MPQGFWSLQGVESSSSGSIEITGDQTYVSLFAERFRTANRVRAQVEKKEDILWLYFPIETGRGQGEAALRFQGNEAMLPLGARRGEFEEYFVVQKGTKSDVSAEEERSLLSLERERKNWERGSFLIQSGGETLGVLEGNTVQVFDLHWFMPEPYSFVPRYEGADMILRFPIEPNFHGEDAMIRINMPLRKAVVPIALDASPLDRQLELEPGLLSSKEKERLMNQAIQEANDLEQKFVQDQVRSIFAGRTCVELVKISFAEDPIWKGYTLDWSLLPQNDCALSIEGTPLQHRRRFQGRFIRSEIYTPSKE